MKEYNTDYESPASGILKNAEYDDCISFKISCDCTSNDHTIDQWIEIEHDEDGHYVEICHYIESYAPANNMSRWKVIWNLLMKGHITEQHSIVIKRQSLKNWLNAMQNSVNMLEEKFKD